MQHVTDTLQTVDESIARKLLEPVDKLERLQTGLSKERFLSVAEDRLKGFH